MPGTPANTNAAKHFGYARITLSNLPAKMRAVQRAVNDLRSGLEAGCVAAHGSISLSQASIINTAVWAERLLRVWARRLSQGYESLDAAGVAMATDRIERLCKTRDDAIRKLNLDTTETQSVWAQIYGKGTHPALAIPAPAPSTPKPPTAAAAAPVKDAIPASRTPDTTGGPPAATAGQLDPTDQPTATAAPANADGGRGVINQPQGT